MTAQEAAESGLFWFTLWNGDVVTWPTLREAQRVAFQDCAHVLDGSRITGIRIHIFRGKIGVSFVEIHENLNHETESHFVWTSSADTYGVEDISPEEYAHLRWRRSSMQEAKK